MLAISAALALAAVLSAGEGAGPAAVDPAGTPPVVSQPAAEPAAAQPAVAEPAAAEPAVAEPAAAEPVAAEPAAALIRRSMTAYGGERARVRLGRVRVVGKLTSPLHPGEEGRYARVFSRASRLRQEVEFPGSPPEVRILDGARAFRYGEPAPGAVAAALQIQAARLDLPALLLEWEARVADLGEVTHEGKKVRVMGLDLAAGLRIEVGIEPAGARIVYVRGVGRAGTAELDLFTVFHDFRVVDGVLVAFQEEGWANGEPTGDVRLTKVEFPDDVADADFQP